MRVLVTGGNASWATTANRLAARGMEYKSVDIADFDLTDEAQVMEAVEYQPTPSFTAPRLRRWPGREEEQALCRAVNAGGTYPKGRRGRGR